MDRLTFDPNISFSSRRSPVVSQGGMVACSQPLAASAGVKILNQGGNAADAAVATAAALNVTEPTSTGSGGDCFELYYESRSKKLYALNGSGRSPQQLTLQHVRRRLPQGISQISPSHDNCTRCSSRLGRHCLKIWKIILGSDPWSRDRAG